jgi:hypothetical protein
MSRNAIFNSLLALGTAIEPLGPGSTWGETGRRLKTPDKCVHPALFQAEPDETFESKLGQMQKRQLSAVWFIYHSAGKDQSAIPAETTSTLIDQIDAKLQANVHRQSLGGSVYAAFIDGQIRKWEGDLDGLTILMIPIRILLP